MSGVQKITMTCRACGHRSQQELSQLLRQLGMLRRTNDNDPDVLLQLFSAAQQRVSCPACGSAEVTSHLATASAANEDEDAGWPDARKCENCGAPLATERLRLFPQATRCARCQQLHEAAPEEDQQREFCPKCGDVLRMESHQRTGITRYASVCRACGYRG